MLCDFIGALAAPERHLGDRGAYRVSQGIDLSSWGQSTIIKRPAGRIRDEGLTVNSSTCYLSLTTNIGPVKLVRDRRANRNFKASARRGAPGLVKAAGIG